MYKKIASPKFEKYKNKIEQKLTIKGELNPKIKFVLFESLTLKITE